MKFVIIDPIKYELSGKNLFLSNRYSGIDCHDFGNRLNYGLNASFAKEQNYLRLFLVSLLILDIVYIRKQVILKMLVKFQEIFMII